MVTFILVVAAIFFVFIILAGIGRKAKRDLDNQMHRDFQNGVEKHLGISKDTQNFIGETRNFIRDVWKV